MINYEQAIKGYYKEAECRQVWNTYAIYWQDRKLSDYMQTPQSAWQSAYENLKKEGKI